MVSEAATHKLIAGNTGLDFANTINGHTRVHPHEYLKSYLDFVGWSLHAGLLSEQEAHILAQTARNQPGQAAKAFARARDLREAVYRVFVAQVHQLKPPAADLKLLNRARVAAYTHSQIVPTRGGFAREWTDAHALDRMLWHIAISATDLLVSSDLVRVRLCSGEGCDWLFVDNSRNHLRRWCSMEECGNRAKAKRFLKRNRSRTSTRKTGSSASAQIGEPVGFPLAI